MPSDYSVHVGVLFRILVGGARDFGPIRPCVWDPRSCETRQSEMRSAALLFVIRLHLWKQL